MEHDRLSEVIFHLPLLEETGDCINVVHFSIPSKIEERKSSISESN